MLAALLLVCMHLYEQSLPLHMRKLTKTVVLIHMWNLQLMAQAALQGMKSIHTVRMIIR